MKFIKFIKLQFIILIFLGYTSHIQALTANQERAKKVVLEYYDKLTQCTKKPESIELHQEIKRLFVHELGWVYNDLLELKKDHQGEKEDDIGHYLTTLMSLAIRENMRFTITTVIDNESWEEQLDPSIDENIKRYNVWVTVKKTIYLLDKETPLFTNHETLKIQEGKILSILPPSESTIEINFMKFYNEKQYDKAFDLCLKRVLDGKADGDAFFYLGLMFRKGLGCKNKYASTVRDKLCVYYWTKCSRGHEGLRNLGWIDKDYYLDNKPLTPIKFDLMPVYKGDGETYGYMNTKGKMVIPYQYKYAYSFSDDGLAKVQFMNSQWGYIDTKGNRVSKQLKEMGTNDTEGNKGVERYKDLGDDCNGYRWVCDQNDRYGFVDDKFNEIIKPKYYLVTDMKKNNFFGCIEKKGEKMGLKNLKEEWILPPTFDGLSFGLGGVTIVYNEKKGKMKYGLIDDKGKLVLPIHYSEINIYESLDGKERSIKVRETPQSEIKEIPIDSLHSVK